MQITAAVGHCLDCVCKQRRIVVFGDIAFGAGLDRACGDGWIVVHAEDDEPRLWLTLEDSAQKLEPRIPRQIDIYDPDVGFVVEVSGQTAGAILRLDDLDFRLRLEERPAPRDDDRVIVDDKNLHGLKSPRGPDHSAPQRKIRNRGPFAASIDSSPRKINGEG